MKELIVSNQEYDSLNRSSSIYISNFFINTLIIENILNNKTYYDYTMRFFNGETNKFIITTESRKFGFSYSKNQLIKAMEAYLKKNNITDSSMINKYNELKGIITLDKLKKDYNDKTIYINVDNYQCNIDVDEIIKLLELDNNKFREILNNDKINGIKKEYFVYVIKRFIESIKIKDNYCLEGDINNNIDDVLNYYVDVESLNKLLTTEDTLYKKVTLDKELESIILDNIPKEFNDLEKSIYVYIMLCRLLSYNEEFHALGGKINNKFTNYLDVMDINIKNSSVTCYQFNLIFSVFLHKLGINFKSEYANGDGKEAYGNGHVKMFYRVGKFLIMADSTENLLEGDMVNAKTGEKITGIRAINKNQNTKDEFNNSLNKVYNYIKNKYNVKEIGSGINSSLKVCDRIKIIIDELNKRKLTGIDAMGYLLRLRKMYFSEEERSFKIRINVVANSKTNDGKLAELLAIIRVNENDLENDDTEYYIYKPSNHLIKTSFTSLKDKFDSGEYNYLDHDYFPIPNIDKKDKER